MATSVFEVAHFDDPDAGSVGYSTGQKCATSKTSVATLINKAKFGRSTEVADVNWITPVAGADWPTRKMGPDVLRGGVDMDSGIRIRIKTQVDLFRERSVSTDKPTRRILPPFSYSQNSGGSPSSCNIQRGVLEMRSSKPQPSWSLGLAAALVLVSATLCRAQFADLAARVPDGANAVFIVDVDQIMRSQLATNHNQ
jgi:hypothetical protein